MPFSPSDFGSDLLVTFDVPTAFANGGLWQDAGKTIPAIKTNDKVRVVVCPYTSLEWTAPSDAARGNLEPDSGGRWSIAGNGTNTAYSLTISSQALPYSVVMRWAGHNSEGVFNIPFSGGSNAVAVGYADDGELFAYTSTGILNGSDVYDVDTPKTISATLSTSAAKLRLNGSQVATGTNAAASVTTLGLFINGAGNFYTGWLSRLIVVKKAFSTQEFTDCETWVAGSDNIGTVLSSWILPTFTNDSTGALRIFHGPDGLSWVESTGVSFTPNSIDTSSGDYSIIRWTNGRLYMGYTRTRDYTAGGLTSFGLSYSDDGLTWTNLSNVDCSSISSVAKVWAPEPFIDGATIYQYFAASTSATYDDTTFRMWETHATNPEGSWSTPTQVIATGSGSFIDGFCVKVGSTYFLWVKNEVTKYIEVYSNSSPTGTFTAHRTGDWMGIGNQVEGPTVRLVNGVWRLYVDRYGAGTGMGYATQTAGDWTGGGSTTWSALATVGSLVSTLRHGTPLKVATAYSLTCAQGSFTLSGQTATLKVGRKLTAAQGSFTLSGQAASFIHHSRITCTQGSYTLSGQSAGLYRGLKLTAGAGSFTLAGQDANLRRSNLATLTAGSGTFSLSGQSANLLYGRALIATQGVYTLSGQAATLIKTGAAVLVAARGLFTLSGQSATLTKTSIGNDVLVTSTYPHGLTTGALVRISGTGLYDGDYAVTVVSPTAFSLDDSDYSADLSSSGHWTLIRA